MSDAIFQGIFDFDAVDNIGVKDFILCIFISLALGGVIAFAYSVRSRCSKSFFTALAMLPAVVCVIIMAVNGNIGAGVAVAGVFGLVRFRSAAGTAKEICALFLAMGAGLLCGMGYLGYSVLFTVILCAIFVLFNIIEPGAAGGAKYKTLTVVIPEELDYSGAFDDIFAEYTDKCELIGVKTTNMGSLFRLTYEIKLKNAAQEKEMLDKLRCRNGNLEIIVSKQAAAEAVL